MKRFGALVGSGLAMSGVVGLIGGLASLAGGVIATVCQVVAVAMLRPKMRAPSGEFMPRWLGGIAVRVAGVALTLVWLPPLEGALGFLAVLLPLLFAETLFLK